jgi:signal transduction histidine kinase
VSIRLRLAVVFTIAAAALFSLGGWLFITQLSSALLSSIDSQLSAQLAQAGRYLPSSGSPLVTSNQGAANPGLGEYLVQVIDGSGRVRGASPDAGTQSLLSAADLRRAATSTIVLATNAEGEPERQLAAPFSAHAGWVAVASVSLETYDHTRGDLLIGIIVAGAIFVLGAGVGSYGLARAALSPVERMRREVAALSEQEPDSRLQVPRTKDEIAALAGTMNDLLARLQQALARQRAFVADASHELRTPFAVLQGELELAGRPGRSREELQAAVRSAADEAARLARLTEDLLLLAHSDERSLPLRPVTVDLGSLLAQSADQARSRAAAADVRCDVEVPPGLEAVVDPNRIRQAVDNLVDNALRFAPHGSRIVLAAAESDGSLVIEVRDSGPGFPADFLPHAFERFGRPDIGRARDHGGAGLGLAIVAAIAMAHGGRAVAINRTGGGATLTLELPGAVRAAAAPGYTSPQ